MCRPYTAALLYFVLYIDVRCCTVLLYCTVLVFAFFPSIHGLLCVHMCTTYGMACSYCCHLSRGEDGARQEAVHVLQELALRRGRVADDANVHVSPQLDAFRRLLVHPAQQHEQNAALHLRWWLWLWLWFVGLVRFRFEQKQQQHKTHTKKTSVLYKTDLRCLFNYMLVCGCCSSSEMRVCSFVCYHRERVHDACVIFPLIRR